MKNSNLDDRVEKEQQKTQQSLRIKYGLGISTLTFSVLQLQIILIKVSSYLFWHHFAYAIIALALLGLGAAGTYLTVKLGKNMPSQQLITRSALGFSLATPLSYMIATRIGFEPLEVLKTFSEHFNMLIIYGVLAVPFFFAGVTISGAIKRYSAVANRLYAFDLAGAGLGCFLIFLLLRPLGATGIVVLCALCGVVSSFLLGEIGKKWHFYRILSAVVFGILFLVTVFTRTDLWPLTPSSAKDIQQIRIPLTVDYTEWDPVARIDVTAPFNLPRAPAFSGVVSKVWHKERHEERGIFQDAAAGTPLYKFHGDYDREMPFMQGTLTSAPFEFLKSPRALIIGAGGCPDCHVALAHDSREVIAVEINSSIVKVLNTVYKEYSGNLVDMPRFKLINAEGRSYTRRFEGKLDIIQLSGVDTFAALASGAYSLAESYLYTVEAIQDFHKCLTANGVLSINRWIFQPPRETLRLAITMVEALDQLGVRNPEKHIYIIGDGAWANTMLKRSPFTEEECQLMRDFVKTWNYDTVYDPYVPKENAFNRFFRGDETSRQTMIETYPMRISPCTDDRPFFFQWYRWSSIWSRPENIGSGGYNITRFPIGNFIMLLTLVVQVTILAACFILYPLKSIAVRTVEKKFLYGLFYACLGIGFMFIEICLMQKLVLFLGHPSYSISVSLFTLLTFAAVGSALSSRWTINGRTLGYLMFGLIGAVLFSTVLATFTLNILLGQHLYIRILATVICIAPAAIMLGIPFPCAIRIISGKEPDVLIPWFWGINGFSSVIASVVAVLLAIATGFNVVILSACLLYAAAAVIAMKVFPQT